MQRLKLDFNEMLLYNKDFCAIGTFKYSTFVASAGHVY